MTENELSYEIIGAAIEVHRILGPGLLESAYEECLCYELRQKCSCFEGRYSPNRFGFGGVKLLLSFAESLRLCVFACAFVFVKNILPMTENFQ